MERNLVWADPILFNKDIIAKYPDNARAHHNLAVAYQERGEDAEKIFEEAKKAIELVPDYVYPRMMIAGYYVGKKKYEDALRELEYVRRTEPQLIEVYKCFAAVYHIQKRYEDAYKQYKKILAWDPANLDAKLGIATIYEVTGDVETAINEYEKILSSPAPFHYRDYYAAAYLKLGDLYANSGKKDMAIKAWTKVYTDFKEEIWFSEIARFLTGDISINDLLSKTKAWQTDFKVIAFYYIAIKKESEGDIEGAKTYYKKCRSKAIQKLDYLTAIAEERLEKLERGESSHAE